MEQTEANKIREIIRPEIISKLSIDDLNKYIIMANEIFPDCDKRQFGTSELLSIRERLNAALQTRIKSDLEKHINDLKKPHWTIVPAFWIIIIGAIAAIVSIFI